MHAPTHVLHTSAHGNKSAVAEASYVRLVLIEALECSYDHPIGITADLGRQTSKGSRVSVTRLCVTGMQLSAEQPKPDLVDMFLAEENMSAAERQKRALQRVGAEFQRAEGDTGSTEVQGATRVQCTGCA